MDFFFTLSTSSYFVRDAEKGVKKTSVNGKIRHKLNQLTLKVYKVMHYYLEHMQKNIAWENCTISKI